MYNHGGNIDCVKMLVNEFKAKIDAAVDTKALQPSDEGEEGPTTMTPMNLARAEASKEIAQFLQSELQKQGMKVPDPNAPRQMSVYAAAVSLVIISACWIWGLMTRYFYSKTSSTGGWERDGAKGEDDKCDINRFLIL